MEYVQTVVDFIRDTQVLQQLREVDAKGLFTNAWFMVPFVALIARMLFKQDFNDLILLAVAIGVWLFSGTAYMQHLVVDGQLQMGKVLPVAGVGIVVIAIVIYVVFMKSD